MFQVGNIGDLSFDNIQFFIDSLREVLQSFDTVEMAKYNPKVICLKENLESEALMSAGM